jgi:hypothetical protein
MTKTEIKIILSVFGEYFNPDELSSLLQVKPTETWMKGDSIDGKKEGRKECCWEFGTKYIRTLDFEKVADVILETFYDKRNVLKSFSSENSLDIKLFVVIKIHNGESPSLFLGKQLISFLSTLDGEIDIDLYAD